mmetsp:Transcript_12101/g.45002  ORF Transcript_12101/g.45002 Transcript_12101/m.45002 type:complete len:343 (+) Transcript_12101:539-1567(+)
MNITRGEYKPLCQKKWSAETRRLLRGLLQREPKRRYSVSDALRSSAGRGALGRLQEELVVQGELRELRDVVDAALVDVGDAKVDAPLRYGIAAAPFVQAAAADAAAQRAKREDRKEKAAVVACDRNTERRRLRDAERAKFAEQATRLACEKRDLIKQKEEAKLQAKRDAHCESRLAKAEHARRVRDAGPRLNRGAMNPNFFVSRAEDEFFVAESAKASASVSDPSTTPAAIKSRYEAARAEEERLFQEELKKLQRNEREANARAERADWEMAQAVRAETVMKYPSLDDTAGSLEGLGLNGVDEGFTPSPKKTSPRVPGSQVRSSFRAAPKKVNGALPLWDGV